MKLKSMSVSGLAYVCALFTVLQFGATLSRAAASEARLAIKAAKILTMDDADSIINNGVVLIDGGKIKALGKASEVEIPEGFCVIEHDGWVMPGLVDAHNHIAGSLSDLNDGVYLTNPGLRTVDVVDPRNENLENALSGGVTSVLLIPGSGNNMSGFGTITKTFGNSVEEMVIRSPGSLKVAQAGNPESYWYGVGRTFMNWNTRYTLEKALAYHEERGAYEKGRTKEARAYDITWEDFRGMFERKFPVSVHTQIYQVYMTTITMLHDHFGLDVATDHSTFDSFKLASFVKERGMIPVVGPRQFHFDGRDRVIHGCVARFWEQGIPKIGINTDAPVIPQEDQCYQATMACWYGMNDHYAAIKGLTRYSAEALNIFNDVGSLEPGKDADISLWTGSPIDPREYCKMTIVNGKIAYDVKARRRTR